MQLGVLKLPTYQSIRKHHSILALGVFPHLILIPRQYFLTHPPNIDRCVFPHQTTSHRYCLLDIFVRINLKTTYGISKANSSNQSENWEIWCTFITHTGAKEKILDGLPQGDKTALVSSFAESVQSNKFGTTIKVKTLHVIVSSAILDVSSSLRKALQGYLTLDKLGQKYFILQQHLRGHKLVDPLTKHQKSIPANLLLHIYIKHHSHLITSIRQIIMGCFFFDMRPCDYSTTPKVESNRTCALRKGDINFYRKQSNLTHSIAHIHFAYKFSLTFRTHKNGVNNVIVT